MGVPLTLSQVPNVAPYIQYVAAANQTVFPYPFPITQDADLIVVVNGATLATDNGYTLSGQGQPNGGNLTFTLGQTGGTIVTLYRNIAIQRITQISQNSGYSSITLNAEFNNFYLIAQQLQASLAQCLQLPNTNNPQVSTTLLPANYAGKYLSFDSNGNPIPAVLTSSGSLTQAIIASLFQPQTAAEVAIGVTPANPAYPEGHSLRYHSTGVPGVSASADTTALLNMYNVCIQAANSGPTASSCDGYVAAGNWLVNEGVLVLSAKDGSNNSKDMAWPVIRTAGYDAVTYTGANFADAPILTLNNGTATSTAFKGWRGGRHEGLTFKTTRSSGSNSHGMSVTGLWGIHFGWMKGTALVNALLYQPVALYGGTDPDPYNVVFCEFDGLETNGCSYIYQNANGIGSSANLFKYCFAANQTAGGIINGGAANTFVEISINPGPGIGYDEGAGTAFGNVILSAEFDGPQYGLRINKGYGNSYTGLRFIHEFQFPGVNSAANYWPRRCIDICGLASPGLNSTRIQATHRIDPGGAHKDIGIFCDFNNSNATTSDVVVEQNLDNQAGITFHDTDFYRNMGTGPQQAAVFLQGRRINDQRISSSTKVAGSAATSILNSGFGTTSNVVAFPSVKYDPNGLFNTTSNLWIAPFSGPAHFETCFALTVAAGTRVRHAIMEMIANSIATTGSLVGGSGYTAGTYNGVQLMGGTGQAATANIVVSGGAVTTVTIVNAGGNFTVGDVLSAVNLDIGGTGTGFSVNVATITALTFSQYAINRVDYAIANTVQSYALDGEYSVVQGKAYCLSADQNTGGSVTPSIPSGAYEPDLYFHARMANMP